MNNNSTQSYDLDRLKAIPFSQVVEKFDTLKRKGCRNVTICPWHEDHNPSLTLYEKSGENRCHCFSCGKGGTTIDYVMQHEHMDFKEACRWLSDEFFIDGKPRNTYKQYKPSCKNIPSEPKNITYIPMELLENMTDGNDSFTKCLMQLYDSRKVASVMFDYYIGCYESWKHPDNTVFPSIDRWGRVHNLKTQHYCTDIKSKDFFHSDKKHILWLGTLMAKEGILPKDSTFDNNCMFGEHLLTQYPTYKVVLVESPKNAVIGAVNYPNYIWLATGNMNMLSQKTLEPLIGRDVIVYPDRDATQKWEEIIKKYSYMANFTISHLILTDNSSDDPKFDIGDYIIANRMKEIGL